MIKLHLFYLENTVDLRVAESKVKLVECQVPCVCQGIVRWFTFHPQFALPVI